jgi:FtsH-binding integral membrane protein
MAFAQAAVRRPIAGAVATAGVSDRVAFLRKTYGVLGAALIAFAVLTAGVMRFATESSLHYARWFYGYRGPSLPPTMWHALIVGGLFVAVCLIGQRLAQAQTSRAVQYLGLVVGVVAYVALLVPLLWIAILGFGDRAMLDAGVLLSGQAATILGQSVIVTIAIFLGLTLSVFITRKDFSFLRGALTMGAFAMIGVALASWGFGFSLGALYFGAGILLMGGYILYQTSAIMSSFPPSGYVAAALMLFGTVATLFIYVLQFVMSLNQRR